MDTAAGMASATRSNAVTNSGISSANVGQVFGGPLQTIGESEMALSTKRFYYDASVAQFNAPSSIRMHGNARQTIQNTTFGARASVNLPRNYMNYGPACLKIELPIDYAWAGCEYALNLYKKAMPTNGRSVGTVTDAEGAPVVNTPIEVALAYGDDYMFESPGCSTMLPTSFMSGGAGFAFFDRIEMSLGGGGQVTLTADSNFVAIMASCPTRDLRRNLMRLAGGGLNLYDHCESRTAPVRWGQWKGFWRNCTGHSASKIPYMPGTNELLGDGGVRPTTSTLDISKINSPIVPISWNVLVPFKTPETNFSSSRRKPLDVKCLNGNLQYVFDWGRFDTFTDTGRGFPNAPVYLPVVPNFDIANVDPEAAAVVHTPYTGMLPFLMCNSYTNVAVTPNQQRNCAAGYELGAPVKGMPSGVAEALLFDYDNRLQLVNSVIAAPSIWTNHYRVAMGWDTNKSVINYSDTNYFNTDNGVVLANDACGRPRFPQYLFVTKDIEDNRLLWSSNQRSANYVNDPSRMEKYPTAFTSIEYVNSDLRLTNEALGAYYQLRSQPGACIYYPFNYFHTQVFRANKNPWQDFTNYTADNIEKHRSKLANMMSDECKITQMITMPNNPVTSLIISIYRAKDRKFLTRSQANSYSPVLRWMSLNPLRATLRDGGSIIYDYSNNIDAEMYGLVDRPDALKIPFRGGLCQVSPQGIHHSRLSPGANVCDRPVSSGFDYSTFGVSDNVLTNAMPRPLWFIRKTTASVPEVGVGFNGSISNTDPAAPPSTSVNAFPVDDLVPSLASSVDSKKFQPCHLTEEYEATLLEFPFAMLSSVPNESVVQNTLTFKNTYLSLDFWIEPTLKPDNGLDDMYDSTYGTTRGAPTGLIPYQSKAFADQINWPNPVSHPVPHCYFDSFSKTGADSLIRGVMSSGLPEDGLTTNCSVMAHYINGFNFQTANSWNLNNGEIYVGVIYCQDNVWCISPTKTSVLNTTS